MRITCRIKMKDRKCSLAFLFTFYEYMSSKLCGSFAAYCFDLFLIYPGFHAINRVRVGPCTRRCLCILIQKFNISTHRSGQLALFCTLNMVAWKNHLNSLKGGSYSRIIKIFDDLSVAYQSIQFRILKNYILSYRPFLSLPFMTPNKFGHFYLKKISTAKYFKRWHSDKKLVPAL